MAIVEHEGVVAQIVLFKGREIDLARPVDCFLNIHESKHRDEPWYSIRQAGVTVGHANAITLKHATFMVNQKVIETGRKNVHAVVAGSIPALDLNLSREVYYDPYVVEEFELDGDPITTARLTTLMAARAYV